MKKTELEKELENHKKLLNNLTSMVDTLKWVIEHPKQIEVKVTPEFRTLRSDCGSTTWGYGSAYNTRNIEQTVTCNNSSFVCALQLKYYLPVSTSLKTLDAVVVKDGSLNLLGYTFDKETGDFTAEFKVNAMNGKHHYKYAVNLYGPINYNTIKLSHVCAANRECPAVMYHVGDENRVYLS